MDQPTAPPGKISKYKTICSSGNLRGGGGGWNSREGKEKGHEIPPNRREGCCLRSAWLCRAGDGEVNPLHPRPAGLRGVGLFNCCDRGRNPPGDRDNGRAVGLPFCSISRESYQGRNSASITMH